MSAWSSSVPRPNNSLKSKPLRGSLTIAALFLLASSSALNAAEEDRVYVGKVLDVSKRTIELDQTGSTLSIGFVGDADALLSLEKIKLGNEVRAVFGVAPGPGGRSVNKLVSIRVCTRKDKECAADRKRQDEERKELMKRYAVVEQERTRCMQAMQTTLASDSRYVPESSAPVSKDDLSRYNALSAEERACEAELFRQHRAAFFEACELHHCGDDVGGGCSHLAGYSMNSSAIEKAIKECRRR